MILFFRKIRQYLLSRNRVTTYFLYAVGEIFLVVIGILIALQVNNWNEDRKNAKEELQVLNLLHEDLVLAKTNSEDFLKREQVYIEKLLLVLGNEDVAMKLKDEKDLDLYFYDVFWGVSHELPEVVAYKELQNSGKTGIIRNSALRSQLSAIELRIDLLEAMLGDRLAVHQKRIDNIAENEINFLPILASHRKVKNLNEGSQNDYFEILKKSNIRNLMAIKLELSYEVLKIRKQLDQELSEVLVMIKDELR